MRLLAMIVAAILVAATNATYAQHPIVLEKLRAWDNATPPPPRALMTAEVMKAAAAVQKRSGGCIASSAVIEKVSPATGVRFVFQGILSRQIKNAWTIVAQHPNCGPEVTRYAIVERKDGIHYTIRINQGRSHANESLIGDTLPLAILGAETALKRAGVKCIDARAALGITRVTQEEPDLGPEIDGIRYTGSWSEVWPISMCGRSVEVLVRFTGDGDGGAHHEIKGGAIRVVQIGS